MKPSKKPSSAYALLLFAGLLAMPAFAQQEVSPDHFDDPPAARQAKKAASHQAAGSTVKHAAGKAQAKSQSKPVETASLKANVEKAQASQSPR